MLFPEEERISKQEDVAVFNLALTLPIGRYLEELKIRVLSKEKIKKFGPKDGRIGYSFTYNKKIRLLEGGLRLTEDIFGVVLDGNGVLSIWNKRCARSSGECMESTNPLEWAHLYDEAVLSRKQMEAREKEPKKMDRSNKGWFMYRAGIEFPLAPRGIGAEVLMREHEINIALREAQELAEKENLYKKGNLGEMVLIENINSQEGFQKLTVALKDFQQGFR